MRMLGVPGVFAPTGSPEFLLTHFGLDAESIRSTVRAFVTDRLTSGCQRQD
jgi:transketolase